MIIWLRSLFAWRAVEGVGGPVWRYYENTVTGRRKAIRVGGCYQPLNHAWLHAGAGAPVVVDVDR